MRKGFERVAGAQVKVLLGALQTELAYFRQKLKRRDTYDASARLSYVHQLTLTQLSQWAKTAESKLFSSQSSPVGSFEASKVADVS